MNIIYLANYRIPTEKAHGLQIMKSCEAFALSGHSVRLVVPQVRNRIHEDAFTFYGVKRVFELEYVRVPEIPFLSERWTFHVRSALFSLLQVARFFRLRKVDIFYARGYIPWFFLALGGFTFVAEVHDYRSPRSRKVLGFALRRARAIIANSAGTKDAVLRHYDIPETKIRVLPNGIDLAFFMTQEPVTRTKERLHVPAGKHVIGYVGRLETVGREKGVRDLLDAFRVIVGDRDDAMLYVVGGPDGLADAYRRSVGSAPVVFTGQVRYADVPSYLRAMDVLVLPMPDDRHALTTSPIKLFEYMASGKPIVASDLPSLRRHLNEDNAFLYEAEDVPAMAAAILSVLGNPQAAERVAEQAKRDVEQYSWLSRARKITECIA